MELGVKSWRRLSMALLLGTAGYAGAVAVDLAAPALLGAGPQGSAFTGQAQARGAGAHFGLGRAATPEEVAAWDIDVRPDGQGLPPGRGDVATGEEIFAEKCASCHGDFGEGVGRWPVLAGGQDSLDSDDPVKTVGSYWPYLSTVWDYVHRAMPFGDAQSLTDDEVYAITAYILYVNDLVDDEEFVLSDENFGQMRLPNEDGFYMDDREDSALFGPREACMTDCKPEAKIVMRARVLDVTPEEAAEAGDGGAEASTETAAPGVDAALAAAGEKVFASKCRTCHQMGEGAKNKTGPVLTASFGAAVASVEGFRYSKALRQKAEEGAVWDAPTLDAFLTKPKAWAKRTKMSFAGVKKEDDRLALIEYLKASAK